MGLRARLVRTSAVCIAGIAVAGATARPASADPVRLDFHITLTSTFGDMAALAGTPLGPGDTIPASLVYDPSAPILRPDDVGFAQYSPAGSLTLGFGPGIVLPLEGMIVVESYFVNGILQQAFVGAFGSTSSFPGFDFIRAELEFRGGDRKGIALPGTAADLFARYPNGFLRGAAWQTGVNPPFDSGTQEFFGTVAPVPEPGTLILSGAGLAMLARRWRQRSKSEPNIQTVAVRTGP
jgi:hypothetical protein